MSHPVGEPEGPLRRPKEEPPTGHAYGHVFEVGRSDATIPGVPVHAGAGSLEAAFSAMEIGANEKTSLIGLGCPEDDARVLTGKGYFATYQENLAHYPPSVALALLTLVISQDPAISPALFEKIRVKLAETGCSGVYFLKDFSGKITHVFKPEDEEMYMSACPRTIDEEYSNPPEADYPVRRSIAKGRLAKNEVAAAALAIKYLGLDLPVCYYVSPSVQVNSLGTLALTGEDPKLHRATKSGSLQEFKEGQLLGVILRGASAAAIPKFVSRIHQGQEVIERMTLADLLLGNCDRQCANIIVDPKARRLYPIDQGLTFPDGMSLAAFARRGKIYNETRCFSGFIVEDRISDETKGLYTRLDLAEVGAFARSLDVPESAVEELLLRGHFLKIALEKGATLRQLVDFCQEKPDDGGESGLRTLANEALTVSLDAEGRGRFHSYLDNFKRKTEEFFTKK